MSSSGGGFPSMEEIQMQQQQKAQYEEQRASILDQILDAPAKERLSRLAIVKKDKVRQIEDSLIKSATTRQLAGKVTDEQIKSILAKSDEVESTKKIVTVQRRKYGSIDEDEDEDDSDLL